MYPCSVRALTACAAASALFLGAAPTLAQDATRSIQDGGIAVDGWMGRIDASEASRGATLEDARLAMDGEALHATTGPAVAYWKPSHEASGSYTVKATFTEPAYMALNDHPHPYGIFVAGNEMGTDSQTYLYCAAYGNGSFIVRGFGPEPFQMNGRRAQPHEAVKKASAAGAAVTQEIAINVLEDRVECAINGTVVATYPKSEVVGAGKLASTDGIYGIRLGHNTEARVTGLSLTPR